MGVLWPDGTHCLDMSKVVQVVLGTGATAPRSGLGLGFVTAAAHGVGFATAAVTVGGLGLTTAAVVVPTAGVAPVMTVLHGGLCASALHKVGIHNAGQGDIGVIAPCDQAGPVSSCHDTTCSERHSIIAATRMQP
jgi:hypothetical protein